jgi:hypothetical protein
MTAFPESGHWAIKGNASAYKSTIYANAPPDLETSESAPEGFPVLRASCWFRGDRHAVPA